ncbi:DeoR/GlpR family DNA-binding transcription regulator [Mangrovibacter plantisponsor]|uniref:DeoR family transcriptional regulator n=1 Tax=Mangrovibacter plantisponsor TaxID=451513 RepID=A0A317PZP8_9ENTR|nr:DeoR/GlpR family DNA-binding transcription regulator [Mangrovibacter plantisponsor]PWW07092.1 DeoR family transcriptional regulator [Mangrovibacter plantisponsor]
MTDYDAFPEQRQARIQEILAKTGRVIGTDLARDMGVSEHTIRRDLQQMARKGLCKKVYGGAISEFKQSAIFDVRAADNVEEKSCLARKCAQLIRENTCIFLDAGSTYLAMVEYIPEDMEITIVTNSPQIAAALSSRAKGELILLGGKVNHLTGSTLGSDTVNQVREMLFDQTFIGVCGLDSQVGLSAVYYEDACFKKEILSQSNEVVAAVTQDKMSKVARYKVAQCDDIDIIIVSQDTNVSGFENLNMHIERAS